MTVEIFMDYALEFHGGHYDQDDDRERYRCAILSAVEALRDVEAQADAD